MKSSSNDIDLKKEKLRLLEEKQKIREGLPHLHGFKFFKWSRLFFESTNKFNFLSSANQCSKSSTSIRKIIHWCTAKHLWPKLWPGKTPHYFFYLYPSLKLATREVKHKWIPEFLPRGEFKDHPVYGWKDEYKGGEISAIHFNTGVSILFLSYSMSAEDLQASSPSAIFCDEEIPVQIYPELVMRLEASKGYFHLVCTPTLGQKFFQEIFEKKRMEDAFAMTVSLYQCLEYEDGSPGMYTIQDIKRREAMLGTKAEIDMRVHGKFVKTEGLVYPSFDREKNYLPAEPVPKEWLWFSGVDPGSGGPKNHPAAIVFIAVSPDFKRGRVVETWRGNNVEITTSEDVLKKYISLRGERVMSGEYYDWADKDFHTIASRTGGTSFVKADKDKYIGVNMTNALFKNQMLTIDQSEENFLLVEELESFRVDTNTQSRGAINDLCDATRYAVAKIYWDFTGIRNLPTTTEKKAEKVVERLTTTAKGDDFLDLDEIDAEIAEWNELYEG